MTDAQQALAQVREALAAGPTPGEWRYIVDDGDRKLTAEVSGSFMCDTAYYPWCPDNEGDWKLIAACSPPNIAAILAHVDAQAAENERLTAERDKARAERDALADVLPGYYYMDPPDGGNVPVLEQLRRMAKDAERYRFLSCKGVPPYFHRCSRWRLEYWNGEWWDPLMKEELDAAIDAQIEQERSEQAKEPK